MVHLGSSPVISAERLYVNTPGLPEITVVKYLGMEVNY